MSDAQSTHAKMARDMLIALVAEPPLGGVTCREPACGGLACPDLVEEAESFAETLRIGPLYQQTSRPAIEGFFPLCAICPARPRINISKPAENRQATKKGNIR